MNNTITAIMYGILRFQQVMSRYDTYAVKLLIPDNLNNEVIVRYVGQENETFSLTFSLKDERLSVRNKNGEFLFEGVSEDEVHYIKEGY